MKTTQNKSQDMCKWLENSARGDRKIQIRQSRYTVVRQAPGYYTLYKAYSFREGKLFAYSVCTGEKGVKAFCTCPDAAYRNPENCKHIRAMRAAVAVRPY